MPYSPPMLRSAALYEVRTAVHVADHAWPVYEINYLHAGEEQWALDDGSLVRVTGGHCSLVQPLTHHRMVCDVLTPLKGLALCVKPEPPARCPPFSKEETAALFRTLREAGSCVVQASPEVDGMYCALRDALGRLGQQAPSPLQAAWLHTLMAHLLVGLVRSFEAPTRSPHHAAIERARRYIDLHLEDDLPVGDIARAARLKTTRFHQLFLRELGVTPADYRLRRRMERAREQLLDPARDITEIAHSLGFSSSQWFASTFKRHFAITPTAYRRQAQAEIT